MNKKRREEISDIIEQLEGLMSEVESLKDEESGAYETCLKAYSYRKWEKRFLKQPVIWRKPQVVLKSLIGY